MEKTMSMAVTAALSRSSLPQSSTGDSKSTVSVHDTEDVDIPIKAKSFDMITDHLSGKSVLVS
jgi:hypothetical protein